jgi:hypothetical protein
MSAVARVFQVLFMVFGLILLGAAVPPQQP